MGVGLDFSSYTAVFFSSQRIVWYLCMYSCQTNMNSLEGKNVEFEVKF